MKYLKSLKINRKCTVGYDEFVLEFIKNINIEELYLSDAFLTKDFIKKLNNIKTNELKTLNIICDNHNNEFLNDLTKNKSLWSYDNNLENCDAYENVCAILSNNMKKNVSLKELATFSIINNEVIVPAYYPRALLADCRNGYFRYFD